MSIQPNPPPKQRDISSYFTAHPRSSVPQKRPSPSSANEEDNKSLPPAPWYPTSTAQGPSRSQREKAEPLRTPQSSRSVRIPVRTPSNAQSNNQDHLSTNRLLFNTYKSTNNPTNRLDGSFSFSDAPSTQTVKVDGKVVAVRDSDDDTESLISLDDLFGRKEIEGQTASSSPPSDPNETKFEDERLQILNSFTKGLSDPIIGKDKIRNLHAKERAQKFDIHDLLGDYLDEQETENKIRRVYQSYKDSNKELEYGSSRRLDQDTFTSLIKSDQDDLDDLTRVLNAIDRTEALSGDTFYTFFSLSSSIVRTPSGSFPNLKHVDHDNPIWSPIDFSQWSRICESSMITDLAATNTVDDVLLSWIFHQVSPSPKHETIQKYIDCMRSGSQWWTRTGVSYSHVQRIFKCLGASSDEVKANGPIQPTSTTSRWNAAGDDIHHLLTVVDMFRLICENMDFIAAGTLASTACRIALDSKVMGSSNAVVKVENLLAALLNLPDTESRIAIHDHLLTDLGKNLRDSVLLSDLLSHIQPLTQHMSAFRIKLAYNFLLDSSIVAGIGNDFLTSLDALINYVNVSPLFQATQRTGSAVVDYTILKATTQILDVAISNGGRPATFSSEQLENIFNDRIDELAECIRTIYISITDSGASHMRRTEAKDTLQTLYWRLLYAVRTKERPKKHIFDMFTGKHGVGDEVRDVERGRKLMAGFLARTKARGQGNQDLSQKPFVSEYSPSTNTSISEDEALIRAQLQLNT